MAERKTAVIVNNHNAVYCGLRAQMAHHYDGDDSYVCLPCFEINPYPGSVIVYDSPESAERARLRLLRRYYQHSLAVVS